MDFTPPPTGWEGAIGLQTEYAAEYAGSDRHAFTLQPGLYLRWGRFSLATSGNFRNRSNEDVVRGLGAALIERSNVRMQLGLRVERGRKDSVSDHLAGLDEVRDTVRARLALEWRPVPAWRLGAGLGADLLRRGGGRIVDFGITRNLRWSARTTASLGLSYALADEDYLRTRYGISQAAAVRTGYAAYGPRSGPVSTALTLSSRTDLDPRWTFWWSATATRLLGPAAASPLAFDRNAAGVGAGFAWRF